MFRPIGLSSKSITNTGIPRLKFVNPRTNTVYLILFLRSAIITWMLTTRFVHVFPVTCQRYGGHTVRSKTPCCTQTLRLLSRRPIELELLWLKFYIVGIGNFALFCCCDLDLSRWPSYTNLTGIPRRYPRRPKIISLRQGFWKLSYYMHTYIRGLKIIESSFESSFELLEI